MINAAPTERAPKSRGQIELLVLAELKSEQGCEGATGIIIEGWPTSLRDCPNWTVAAFNAGTRAPTTVKWRCWTSCRDSSDCMNWRKNIRSTRQVTGGLIPNSGDNTVDYATLPSQCQFVGFRVESKRPAKTWRAAPIPHWMFAV